MKLSCIKFESVMSPAGPDISFSLYHECLHSIAFTHAKILSLPRHKFIDLASPANDNGTISVQFLLHWRKQLLLPLFLQLLHIYIKPQLHLSDGDYQHIIGSFDNISSSDIAEILGLSLKHIGCHLHIIQSVALLNSFVTANQQIHC